MKRVLFITLFSLFAAIPLFAADTSNAESVPVAPTAGPKETSMEGTWQAYSIRDGIVVGRPAVRYIFGKLGWGIREGDKEAVVQDWYKRDGVKLYLRPAAAPKDIPEMALTAQCDGADAFTLSNPGTPGTGLLFERVNHNAPLPTLGQIKGSYDIVQTDIDSKATRAADYALTLHADGTYTLDGIPLPPPPHAKGTYTLTGDVLTLRPAHASAGFWNNPKFFPYKGAWVCDNRMVAVSLKRIKRAPLILPPKESAE